MTTRKLTIERQGKRVVFVVECFDEYDAMMLYDQGVKEAAGGVLELTVATEIGGEHE